jgi:hypothetical protein
MKRPVSATMKSQGAKGVIAYLATVPVDARGALQELRRAIRAAAPDAKEGFSRWCVTRRRSIIAASTR